MKTVLLFTLLFMVSCAGIFAQQPVTEIAQIDTVYLAKDDGKGAPGDTATVFSVSDVPIHCVVKLDSPDPATVKMYLVAVSVNGVKPGSRIVSTSYTTKDGQNEVYFNGRPEKLWYAGQYRADIFVDGKPFRSLDFIVTSPAPGKGNTFAPKSASAKPHRPRTKVKGN